jgi:3D-(3,5/4)-trihydroxycyclohexane-1,2-dione acylhydrolase (decyclizing)
VLDNRGFGCINRLQQACGGASFNNLLGPEAPAIDFAAHARSLGAHAEQVKTVPDLEGALDRARRADRTAVVVIETDPGKPFTGGGAWWDVPVPEVSDRPEVRAAHEAYDAARRHQWPRG